MIQIIDKGHPTKSFVRYLCGYLIRKCLGRHTRDICENYARKHEELDDSSLLCYMKVYETNESPFGA